MSYPNYSHFSILGYATHHDSNSSHNYRVVNPLAKKENYDSFSGTRPFSKISSSSKNVIHYDATTNLQNYPYAFVWFYATWCGHCIQMEKDFEKAADSMSSEVAFIKIDSDQFPELCAKYKVDGFPTLKLFVNGMEKDTYSGIRKADSFIQWLQQRV